MKFINKTVPPNCRARSQPKHRMNVWERILGSSGFEARRSMSVKTIICFQHRMMNQNECFEPKQHLCSNQKLISKHETCI